jgi:hypothetical protein
VKRQSSILDYLLVRRALGTAFAAAALAACGGGSEPTGSPTTAAPAPPPPPATETAAPAETGAPAAEAEPAEPERSETSEPASPSEPPASAAPEPAAPAEAEPATLPGLPPYTAGYERWTRINPEPIPPNPDGDPHLGTKDVYVSQEADRSGGSIVYPDGTIVVKDARRPDADFLGLVAIMRKETGSDPEHGDWVFVEYTRDSPDAAFTETASDAVCWSCHVGAEETDWVWVHTLRRAP